MCRSDALRTWCNVISMEYYVQNATPTNYQALRALVSPASQAIQSSLLSVTDSNQNGRNKLVDPPVRHNRLRDASILCRKIQNLVLKKSTQTEVKQTASGWESQKKGRESQITAVSFEAMPCCTWGSDVLKRCIADPKFSLEEKRILPQANYRALRTLGLHKRRLRYKLIAVNNWQQPKWKE